TWGDWGSAQAGGGATAARISAERFRTDGHDFTRDDGTEVTQGTDADLWSATGRVLNTTGAGEIDAFVGYGYRAFGALDFYAPYPSWERTRTMAGTLRVNRRVSDRLTVEPRFAFRRHEDRFVLIRTNPDAYTNDHVSRRYAGELRGLLDLGGGHALAAGLEGVYEDIASTGVRGGVAGPALGDHLRRRLSVSAELDRHGAPLSWQLGGRVDLRSSLDPRASVTGAVAYDLAGPAILRASAGSIHRVPTFTDLYYADPANRGNPDLKPEHGWAWDAGVELTGGPWQAGAAFFARHETDLIDWARPVGDTVWQVLNVAEGTVRGVETTLGWRASRGHRLTAGWAWLERSTSLTPGYAAKYALLVPRHNLTCAGTAVLPAGFAATAVFRYVERSGGPDDFRVAGLVDARLDWARTGGWFASLTGTNLTDRRVMEVPGVVLPGVLLTGSAGLRF
ncbi:MAG: TonB-dependent receptor, partial [Krumholzibacteria bacterium]|nr:TonB-dependent receptor [Candidatus Krumholzibacteria bacterium]